MFTSKLIQTAHGFSNRDEESQDILKNLGAKKLITAKQVHSNIAHFINGDEDGLEGDALITNKPNIAVGIYTADCGPILLADEKAGIVGAVHAGWKGARYGIIENSINLMKIHGAKNIVAVLGPCIHQNSYEVSADFKNNFISESQDNEAYFVLSKNKGHLMFNLPDYIQNKLKQNGVDKVESLNQDTLSQPEVFCSFPPRNACRG